MTEPGPRGRRESLSRLLGPAMVPRHMADPEPRGESIADGLHDEHWNGVGWIEDGPAGPLRPVDPPDLL